MNTFEPLIGKTILKMLRIDAGEWFPQERLPLTNFSKDEDGNDPPLKILLAIFIVLTEDSGLLIGFTFREKAVTLSYRSLKELKKEYGVRDDEEYLPGDDEYLESDAYLNELEQSDPLNTIIGQQIRSIRIGQIKDNKFYGNDFIVKNDIYAGIVIKTDKQKLTIFTNEKEGKILLNSDELFSDPEG